MLMKEFEIKLDFESFKSQFSPIFWNSVWYFSLLELPIEFFLPYQQSFNITQEAALNLTNLNVCIEKQQHQEKKPKSRPNKSSFMTFNEERNKTDYDIDTIGASKYHRISNISSTDSFQIYGASFVESRLSMNMVENNHSFGRSSTLDGRDSGH